MSTTRIGRVEAWVVADPVETVAGRLERDFAACFGSTERRCQQTTYSGGGASGGCIIEGHHWTVERSAEGNVTLVELMQTNTRGGNMLRAADGSVYEIVVDLSANESGTSITAYGYGIRSFEGYFTSIMGWSRSDEPASACPSH